MKTAFYHTKCKVRYQITGCLHIHTPSKNDIHIFPDCRQKRQQMFPPSALLTNKECTSSTHNITFLGYINISHMSKATRLLPTQARGQVGNKLVGHSTAGDSVRDSKRWKIAVEWWCIANRVTAAGGWHVRPALSWAAAATLNHPGFISSSVNWLTTDDNKNTIICMKKKSNHILVWERDVIVSSHARQGNMKIGSRYHTFKT